MTVAELVTTAIECQAAGADGIHIHIRDQNGEHTLDPGLYREALAELELAVPEMVLQITTEAVGRYSSKEQRTVIENVRPDAVSVSIAEMCTADDFGKAHDFYQWCCDAGISVQHILYGPIDMLLIERLYRNRHLRPDRIQLLFVLGRYAEDQQSQPSDLLPFTDWLSGLDFETDWAVCAFGRGETECLGAAAAAGGKVRVGFENSLWNADGSVAANNAARVAEVYRTINA